MNGLARYQRSRHALLDERARLLARVALIDAALAQSVTHTALAPAPARSGAVCPAIIAWLEAHPGWHRSKDIAAGVCPAIDCAVGSVIERLSALATNSVRRGARIRERRAPGRVEYAALGTPEEPP